MGSNYTPTDNSEKAKINRMYSGQKASSKKRKHKLPNYNIQEFTRWLYKNNFSDMYDNWFLNNYDKDLMPSVDRLKDCQPYTLNNIQLITWGEHKHKSNIGNNNSKSSPVKQYSKDGALIVEYSSQKEASKATGVSQTVISISCNSEFVWRFS